MAKIVDIRPVKSTPIAGGQAELMKRWEASLSPAQREAREAKRREKEIRRQLRNAEARQRRAALQRASSPTAAAAGGGGGGAQVSRSPQGSAPRAASVNGGNMSGSSRPRRAAPR